MTWLKNKRHPVGYWIKISNSRALFEQNGYMKELAKPQQYGLMINRHLEEYSIGIGDTRTIPGRKVRA
jgi:hypothetical protein